MPFRVVRVKVDPSVKNIDNDSFNGLDRLRTVQLPEGMESIGKSAFDECKSLERINIPSTVKVIGDYAFQHCERLQDVNLPDGLKKIGKLAFDSCYSLRSIEIPASLKSISDSAFFGCRKLKHVVLHEGLEYIGTMAFGNCSLLRQIDIPSTVKEIKPNAFICVGNSNLSVIKFCDDMEEFVSGLSLRDWWDNGISEYSLKTYNFLVRCNVPARLSSLSDKAEHARIRDDLKNISSVPKGDFHLDNYFKTIGSKLTAYEIAQVENKSS